LGASQSNDATRILPPTSRLIASVVLSLVPKCSKTFSVSFYRRRFPVPRLSRKVWISDEKINRLVKRGYLAPNELDDTGAIKEALSLFVWDAL
jgi:hypothetical protein